MATKTLVLKEDNRDERYKVYLWEELGNGDDGSPIHLGGHADRSVQVEGTFGVGGKVVFEGSLMHDSPTFRTAKDFDGVAVEITSAGLYEVRPCMVWGRPRVTAGDGTTDLDVYIMVRK